MNFVNMWLVVVQLSEARPNGCEMTKREETDRLPDNEMFEKLLSEQIQVKKLVRAYSML